MEENPTVEITAEALEVEAAVPSRCPVGLKPMESWIAEPKVPDSKECKPCMMGPVVSWYADELKTNGKGRLADHLVETATTADPLTVCKELDSIKAEVETPLRERLKDFDCAAQSFNHDEDET